MDSVLKHWMCMNLIVSYKTLWHMGVGHVLFLNTNLSWIVHVCMNIKYRQTIIHKVRRLHSETSSTACRQISDLFKWLHSKQVQTWWSQWNLLNNNNNKEKQKVFACVHDCVVLSSTSEWERINSSWHTVTAELIQTPSLCAYFSML